MKLILVTGFLGSGKTSLIIRLADLFCKKDRKTVVLVNEIGDIGIDNMVMRKLGLNVWELLNGCVCCSLAGDLVDMLHQLVSDHAPDFVVVEPSGAADPSSVLKALSFYKGPVLDKIAILTILDPLRLHVLMEVMTPLIVSHMKQADCVVIGKSDMATSDEMTFAETTARKYNPSAPVVPFSTVQYFNDAFYKEIKTWTK